MTAITATAQASAPTLYTDTRLGGYGGSPRLWIASAIAGR